MQVQFNNVTLNGTAQVGSVPFFVSDLFTNGETGVWGDNLDPAMMFAADTAVTATALSGVVTWNGSTVRLYLDGVEVYSGAQPGEVNTMVPMNEGALNQNGTAESFFAGTISQSLNRAMRPAEYANIISILLTDGIGYTQDMTQARGLCSLGFATPDTQPTHYLAFASAMEPEIEAKLRNMSPIEIEAVSEDEVLAAIDAFEVISESDRPDEINNLEELLETKDLQFIPSVKI